MYVYATGYTFTDAGQYQAQQLLLASLTLQIATLQAKEEALQQAADFSLSLAPDDTVVKSAHAAMNRILDSINTFLGILQNDETILGQYKYLPAANSKGYSVIDVVNSDLSDATDSVNYDLGSISNDFQSANAQMAVLGNAAAAGQKSLIQAVVTTANATSANTGAISSLATGVSSLSDAVENSSTPLTDTQQTAVATARQAVADANSNVLVATTDETQVTAALSNVTSGLTPLTVAPTSFLTTKNILLVAAIGGGIWLLSKNK